VIYADHYCLDEQMKKEELRRTYFSTYRGAQWFIKVTFMKPQGKR